MHQNFFIYNSKIEDLNNLTAVNGDLDLSDTPIIKLPDNLAEVNGTLNLYTSKITCVKCKFCNKEGELIEIK